MVGFRIQNSNTISSEYRCPNCLLLLRDPVQLIDCGHRICQSCIDEQKEDMIICSECHDKVDRKKLKPDRGFRNDMYILSINCAFCSWTGILKDYQNHLNQNHSNSTCTYCNDKFTSIDDLNRHQQFICEKIPIECPLKHIGCEEQIPRNDLFKHYLCERHQRVIINFILQFLGKNFHQTKSITSSQLQPINETINVLSTRTETLNDDVKRLDIECVQRQNLLQSIIQNLSTFQKSIDDQNAFVNNMKPNQENLEENLLLATQQLEEIKLKLYDGIYIWKINNVQEKMIAAQSNTQRWIDSPPFYSSPTGYKMCLRIYLNGDDDVRENYISLYFVLMRGEFDAILSYPFCFKMNFSLYDQSNQQKHIIHTLRPDVISNKYHRPRSEMIVAGGISKFASLQILRQENSPYIRDDTIFIKTIIDFNNIEKNVLPYAMNLNPALTIEMQQSMIQQEMEKHPRA